MDYSPEKQRIILDSKVIQGINRSLYILKNINIQVNNYSIDSNSMVELFSEQNVILENNGYDARILMLKKGQLMSQLKNMVRL